MLKRKIIIDTDCGSDDAVAIMAALSDPNTEIIAITVVWGNVCVDQGMENIGKLLDHYNIDIPFYKGADESLLGLHETTAWGGFGSDGFGDAAIPNSKRVAKQSKLHAAVALTHILRDIKKKKDEVYQLVCLGPLTNIAIALRLDADAFKVLGSETELGITVMGGTSEGKGNSSMAAEFNFLSDPEAAFAVLNHRTAMPIQLIPWEPSVQCPMSWAHYDKWIGRGSSEPRNPTQEFIDKIFKRLEIFTRPDEDGKKADTGDAEVTQDITCVVPDPVAIVVALHPEVVLESFITHCSIELHGRETRGALCIDWYGTNSSMEKRGRWRNCKMITRVDNEKFISILNRIVQK
ncbi:unnamed protein product [Phytomonas sp. Hart1]|nr:unnamed protein product [Phytomonas sp. Hart1]|eukprot:CCW69787.1 unnamed protein product [Phytomonas sp. isolate Hart1]